MLAWTCTYLSACQAGYDNQLEDYLNRLENILKVDRTDIIKAQNGVTLKSALPKIPSQRATQIELLTAEASIGILEFLSLDKCAIQQTIAEKNNNLGKVAAQSQQLLNSITFIQQAPACLEILKTEQLDQLQHKLQHSFETKTQQLPYLLWHASLNGAEYRSFWKTANIDYQYPLALPINQPLALKNLFEFSQDVLLLKNPSINLEQTLGIIRQGDGGQLLAAYTHLLNQLQVANQLVQTALAKPFCQANNPNLTQPNIKILHNMVTSFFIPKIQRWSNDLNKRYEELIPSISKLDALYENIEHPKIKQWRKQRNQLFQQARSATKNHVKMINQLYQQCAASPQS